MLINLTLLLLALGTSLVFRPWQLVMGAAVRRWMGLHLFVYVLARAFLGTALCVFVAGLLAQATGHSLPGIDDGLNLVAHWVVAWGDAFLTGMFTALMVAFKPDWLATWSDRLYLGPR